MHAKVLILCCLLALAPAAVGQEPTSAKEAFDPAVARRIAPQEVKKRLDKGDKVIILDIRMTTDGLMIKGARHVPFVYLESWAKDVPKDVFIVTYCICHHEGSSAAAVLDLQRLGFTNAFALLDSLYGWQQAGYPTETVAE